VAKTNSPGGSSQLEHSSGLTIHAGTIHAGTIHAGSIHNRNISTHTRSGDELSQQATDTRPPGSIENDRRQLLV
jgi:hypothetical protein